VILWRYQEERTFEEIGQALGCSADAARQLWRRALERLGRELRAPP
jgi:DNA-directed RNA polymerase specialized sigma24 family protein